MKINKLEKKHKKLLVFSVLFLTITIFGISYSYAYCKDCGPGMIENMCPYVGQLSFSNDYYYDEYIWFSYSCTQMFCDETVECNRNGPVDRICHELLCGHPPGGNCTNPADCLEVDVMCAYSYAFKQGRAYGWWVPGDIPPEAGVGTGGAGTLECRDGHDNDCDGTCDDVGCCSNITFSDFGSCTSNGQYFCQAPAYTEADCNALGSDYHEWLYVNGNLVCYYTGNQGNSNEPFLCDLMPKYEWKLAPNQWLPPDPDCSPNGDKLKFQDSVSGDFVAAIGSNGAMHIKGNLVEDPWSYPMPATSDDFVIQNSFGDPAVVLDRETGDLYLAGNLYGDQFDSITATSGSDFVVTDNSGNIVAVFDDMGNLYLRGAFLDNVASIP